MADRIFRCAIYTRKSTEDGLDQEFNSLDAQYEACAAYALSQRHEGWVQNPERYDDGGFSGGNMDRPGLKRLLAEIEAGQVDIVLLYKIDRLTRSLSDFSRIVDVLDKAGASFVSITQAFNTTTSMGRLTLNMLLSFAQFEREVTGERIRDKIAASKRKGLWMGGTVPLGYRVKNRKLVVVPEEAEQVRHIMTRYLEVESVPALAEELERDGYRTKVQKRASGPHKGGCVYQRGTLYHLLSNRIYLGMTVHKGEAFTGEHELIVGKELFAQVQAKLAQNASGSSRRKKVQEPSLLVGLLEDCHGRPMTPSHSGKSSKSQRYRYYITRPDQVGAELAERVSAPDLEAIVGQKLSDWMTGPVFVLDLLGDRLADAVSHQKLRAKADLAAAELRSGNAHARAQLFSKVLARVSLGEEEIALHVSHEGLAEVLELDTRQKIPDEQLDLKIPAVRVRKGHQLRLVVPGPEHKVVEPPRHDARLVALVADALATRDIVLASPGKALSTIAATEGRCRTRLSKLVSLSCLAPEIVQMICEGRQPAGLTAKRLSTIQLPLSWAEQRNVLLAGSAS
ncbi:recombinase family protein [Altererythrobacter sp. SALINAS58]|uniref:recombinase family protein n=1 Tax=Alteripontixanthobacter muriae TaxID=2705546 RepID=UPI0015760E4E|nr:recombinase family protein [Alteripontixanthobacter muriae]NTZ43992.1 recombinase family protein [Alteripontixanthobacter muriae]